MTLYPTDYRTSMVTMDALVARHGGRLHPEFHRRLFPWIESMGGLIGIGQTYRAVQPNKPGFAQPGRSFHEIQEFASGLKVVTAVDLVATAAKGNPNPAHRSPTWPESATAPIYGLHTFIKGEPWHMQPTDGPSRGWLSWVKAGRPDPAWIPLPSDLQPEPEPIEPVQEDDMLFIAEPTFPSKTNDTPWIVYYTNPGSGPRGARAVGAHIEAAKRLGVPIVPSNSEEHHRFECKQYGIPMA